ncbi:MAG: ATPase, T2SS/T4P/T4SS family [Candidatus Helarchaeota archaeon]
MNNPLKTLFDVSYEIKKEQELIKKSDINCKRCSYKYIEFLQYVKKELEKLKLIQDYYAFFKKDPSIKFAEFLEIYLPPSTGHRRQDIETINKQSNKKILNEQYNVGPYVISIYESNSLEKEYEIKRYFDLNSNQKQRISKMLTNLQDSNMLQVEKRSILNFNRLLKNRMKAVKSILINFDLLPHEREERFQHLICFESIGLNKLLPLFLDQNIEEIYFDGPGTALYLDHEKWGRCKTNLYLDFDEIKNFRTRLRAESNLSLNEEKPSLKTEILTDFFQIRVEMNVSPLAVDKVNFTVRKLRRKVFSITELLKSRTINAESLALVCFFLFHKRSIIIIGEPGSGKTTLLNALDFLTPSSWRKIYIEDVVESLPQFLYGKHQMRFKLSRRDHVHEETTKSYQVRETLHRTPDIVIIGELIHTETIHAFFFLLKVGLQSCLGTCHGTNSNLIIERWLEDEQIPKTAIGNIDLIIQMGKTDLGRRVIKIDEVAKMERTGEIKINTLFHRDPLKDDLISDFSSWEEFYDISSIVNKIRESCLEIITPKLFLWEINELKTIFNSFRINNTTELSSINKKMCVFFKTTKNVRDFNEKPLVREEIS